MGSRIRENPEKIYEVFMEIGKANGESEEPFLIQSYPRDYSDEEVLKSVPKFAFPCDTERYTTTVDHFTFVLTEIDSTLKFVFCRHATGAQTCLCIVSYFPWFEIFYNLLNHLAEMLNQNYERDMTSFLRAAYVQDVPAPGVPVTIAANQDMLNFTAPEANKLPSIPSNRNLTEYYNAMDTSNMMIVFASMLNERRIVVTSRRLSRLTACIHASVSLLYPMFWQHLFIPILPSHLLDYLSAPMPYVIGVHTTLMQKMKASELGDAVIVNVDNNTVQSEYDDLEDLPSDICSYLKRHLKGDKVRISMQTSGDAIPKTFLMALVRLIGGYRDALRFKPGEPITFDPEAFVLSRPQSMQPFLENMLQLQIFQQFINERLDMLNCGQGFSDIFEAEALQNADKLNTQSRYKEWLSNMKKQGNKFQKGGKDIWAGIKEKVKSQSKKAYTGIKNKMADLKKEDEPANMKTKSTKSPSTQKLSSRDRPSTVIGEPLKTMRPPRPSMVTSPTGDKLIVPSSSQDRISRYKMITVEEKFYDDSDVELAYNRVSVNLLSDPDIQQALNRAASAENIVRMSGKTHQLIDHIDGTSSGPSSGRNSPSTVSSSSALEYQESDMAGLHSQANRDTFGSVPFIDISSEDEYVGLSNPSDQYVQLSSSARNVSKSSQEDQNRPVRPPRKSRSPITTGMADRLISDRSKGATPPPPAPHLPKGATPPAPAPKGIPKPTPRQSIKRKSEEFQKQQFATESLMQFQNLELEDSFDPFKSPTSQTVAQIDKLKDLTSPTDDDVNSVTRSPAFRMPGTGIPKRVSMKRDKSLSPEKDSNAGHNLLDFDPLVSNTSQGLGSTSKNTGSQGNPTSPELLQDWNIDHLQTKTYDLGPMPKPGFVQRTAAEFALSSGGQNNISVPYGKRPSPGVLPRPASVRTDLPSSTSSPYSTPSLYNTPLRASSYTPVTSSSNIHKPGTSQSTGNSDPFGDLIGIQLGPTNQPPAPNKSVASPAVNKWETFE